MSPQSADATRGLNKPSRQSHDIAGLGLRKPKALGRTKMSSGLFSIFINYRRQDTPYVIGRIAEKLHVPFGKNQVFHDVDSMRWASIFGSISRTRSEGVGSFFA